MPKTIEEHRAQWAKVAKENGWYKEPFFIQIFKNEAGDIVDSVAHGGMAGATEDLIVVTDAYDKNY